MATSLDYFAVRINRFALVQTLALTVMVFSTKPAPPLILLCTAVSIAFEYLPHFMFYTFVDCDRAKTWQYIVEYPFTTHKAVQDLVVNTVFWSFLAYGLTAQVIDGYAAVLMYITIVLLLARDVLVHMEAT